MALVDYFLKLDGITGDSTDAKHKGEIEVESFSWGVSQTASVGGGGAGAGKAVFQDFHFTSLVTKASPSLMLKCANGTHLKNAILIARGQDQRGGSSEFLKITLSDVLVSSFTDAGGEGQGPSPHMNEAVSLSYASATAGAGEATTIKVTPASGGMLRFDLATNTIEVVNAEGGVFEIGTRDGATTRAALEYDVKILIGLLTSPFSTSTLRLVTTEVREAAIQPTDFVNRASIDSEPSREGDKKPKKAKKIRFDVILYTPADLALTADDLTRKGKRIGTITVDPDGDPATLTTDLTRLLTRRGLETFGIRLQLRGARIKPLDEDDDDENEDGIPEEARSDEAGSDDDHPNGTEADTAKASNSATASFTIELVLDTQ